MRTAFFHACLLTLFATACPAFQLPTESDIPPRLPRFAVESDGAQELASYPVLLQKLREGDAAQLAGRYDEAAQSYRGVGREIEQTLGREALVVRDSLRALAAVELERGRSRQAEKLAFSSLVREQQVRPRSGKRSAASHGLLVDVYLAQHRPLDAVKHAGVEVDLRLKLGGSSDIETSFAFLDLAGAELAARKYEKASHLIRRAMSIQKVALGPDHIDRIRSYGVWSRMMQLEAQPRQAELALERALRILEANLTKDHPRQAPLLSGLSKLYELHGKWNEAIETGEKALRLLKNISHSQPELATELEERLLLLELRMGRLEKARAHRVGDPSRILEAALQLAEGQPQKAFELAQQALDAFLQGIGAEHPRTTLAWSVLAECHRRLGSLRLATNYARRARDRDRKLYSDKGAASFSTKVGLVRCLVDRGEHKAAQDLLDDVGPALGRLNATLHEGRAESSSVHPFQTELRIMEAQLRIEAGQPAEALRLLETAYQEIRSMFGSHSGRLVFVLLRKAEALILQGDRSKIAQVLSELEPLRQANPQPEEKIEAALFQLLASAPSQDRETTSALEQLIETSGRALGATHPLVLRIQSRLAKLLEDLGRKAEARKLWLSTLTGAEDELAKGAPFTLQIQLGLARCYLAEGSRDQALPLLRGAQIAAQDNLDRSHPLIQEIAQILDQASPASP